jgi:transcriptional regulator, lacI family
MRDIAEALGISKGSVSLALNDSKKISEKTKSKVRKLAQKLGYKRNALVSSVMAGLKGSNSTQFLETIVLINANKSEDAPEKYPIFSKYIKGIRAEAKVLGYAVYEVWLHDKRLNPSKLQRILESRGIRGGIIIGHVDDNILPDKFSPIWQNFKFVSAGLKTFNPILDFISADKFLIAHYATKKVIERGYKRPALILAEHIDELVEGRFVGGFLRAQLDLPESDRIPPFLNIVEAEKNPQILYDWLKQHKPDVIFSISNSTSEWFSERATAIPQNLPVIHLERKYGNNDWVGIDQNYEMVGCIAVRKLFTALNAPVYLKDADVRTATIVLPKWNDPVETRKKI